MYVCIYIYIYIYSVVGWKLKPGYVVIKNLFWLGIYQMTFNMLFSKLQNSYSWYVKKRKFTGGQNIRW